MVNKALLENYLNELNYWHSQKNDLSKNPWSSKQRKEMGIKLYNNDTHFSGVHGTPDYLDIFINEGMHDNMAGAIGHATENLEDIIDDTSPKGLIRGALDLTKDYQDMLKIAQSHDVDQMGQYLEKALFENKAGLVRAFRYHTAHNKDIVTISYAQEIHKNQASIIANFYDLDRNGKPEMDEEGNPELNKNRLKHYILEKLDAANGEMKTNFYLDAARAYVSEANAEEHAELREAA